MLYRGGAFILTATVVKGWKVFELKNSLVTLSLSICFWGVGRVEAENPPSPSSLVGTYSW